MKKVNWLLFFLLITPNVSLAFWNGNNWASNYNNQINNPYWRVPSSVMNYYNTAKNPSVWLNDTKPRAQNRVKPSNWLIKTDFSSTLKENKALRPNFTIDNDVGQYRRNFFGVRGVTHNKQGRTLSPAAVSTLRVINTQ
ncbi:hypothetical protein HUE58_05605 [Candidatus Ruthia endofausta]|uniref:Uncharacterized protein n=1 Tax=Candidatus Ruthia endofausta TaxID=2738852 RepID=A0A6N0HQB7_9GAMM|nr:hypothetical protein [Candidatus Ruthia endofausta]QKQ24579.1 hypothetical protein HUE58_05605 [Candidatus Ruthia endofausta]